MGTDKVKTGSTFCFDLVGKAGTRFPSDSKVSIGFRDNSKFLSIALPSRFPIVETLLVYTAVMTGCSHRFLVVLSKTY